MKNACACLLVSMLALPGMSLASDLPDKNTATELLSRATTVAEALDMRSFAAPGTAELDRIAKATLAGLRCSAVPIVTRSGRPDVFSGDKGKRPDGMDYELAARTEDMREGSRYWLGLPAELSDAKGVWSYAMASDGVLLCTSRLNSVAPGSDGTAVLMGDLLCAPDSGSEAKNWSGTLRYVVEPNAEAPLGWSARTFRMERAETYVNERFGFACSWPALDGLTVREADNGDGVTVTDGRGLELRVWGSNTPGVLGTTFEQEVGELASSYERLTGKEVNKKTGRIETWGRKGTSRAVDLAFFTPDVVLRLSLVYPQAKERSYRAFEDMAFEHFRPLK